MDSCSIFNLGAWGYDLLTRQELWRNQIATLVHYLPLNKKLRLLDVGCGPGVSSFVLAEKLGSRAEITGIDMVEKMIDRALSHHQKKFSHLDNVRFLQADAGRLPFADGTFDVVTGHSFLYLVNDRIGVLREIRRVLSADGMLVLMEPSADGSLITATVTAFRHLPYFFSRPVTALRFSACMVLWRCFSTVMGKMSPPLVAKLFAQAGFRKTSCVPTLAGLGIHCIGRI